MKYFFVLLAPALLLAACVSRPSGEKEAVETISREAKKSSVPAKRLPGNGLDSARFRGIPQEAKDYLESLAGAFGKKEKEFLASQGEAQYEKDLRSRYDEEVYLALLYRIGPYSEEMPRDHHAPPRLVCADVEAIEYTDWKEKGPVLEISGYLYYKKGEPIPCGITLVWKLTEIKILGMYP